MCQTVKLLGGRVIGTTSSKEKADIARESGADDVILYTEKDFVQETSRLTDGCGPVARALPTAMLPLYRRALQ